MLKGQQFNEWTVIDRSEDKASGYWLCECSCGVKKDVWVSSLKRGTSKSCGHIMSEVILNKSDNLMIGKRFGRLVILERINDKGRAEYLCQCDCGNRVVVKSDYLNAGGTKSCGCLKSEVSSKSIKNTYKSLEKEREKASQYGSNIHSINQQVSKNSTTKHKGISQMANGKYRAYLYFKGKQYHGGSFNTLNDAIKARKELEEKYYDPIRDKFKQE